ncbi:hypothetical protein BGZ61DRAFT_376738, partial [Ilyonectria robusta]|uniref:uncharacterized protein n=1 Tax=Ilyonectria robusta TaxID=1079257 RepID=UPI001E8D593F
EYHRAIYLIQQILKELTHQIAAKWDINISQIARTIHTTRNRLEVEIDNDIIQELKEGQAIALEIKETKQSSGVKQE